jgi:hypothetical protein
MIKDTEINIGFLLSEPITVLTNIFITLSCVYFYFSIQREKQHKDWSAHWKNFFLWIGISAFLGGIFHGSKYCLSLGSQESVKLIMNLASIPASYSLLRISAQILPLKNSTQKLLNRVSLLSMGVLTLVTIYINQFFIVKIIAGIVILISIFSHNYSFRKGILNNNFVTYGFLFSLSSIVVHSLKLSLNDWFNFKDISHVIMNISLFSIFFGVISQSRYTQDPENQSVMSAEC